MQYFSQLNPSWKNKNLPNCSGNITIGNYGCLLTCLANIVQKQPDILASENSDCFNSQGFMNMDKLADRLGYKIVKTEIQEGSPLPVKDKPYIARTSWFADKGYPTHFFIVLPNGNIIDPASNFNPKSENRYIFKINEINS